MPGLASRSSPAPPAPSNELLGREDALRAAIALVQGGARLMTVMGYGGTGKTRFAIELFHRLANVYPGGAAGGRLTVRPLYRWPVPYRTDHGVAYGHDRGGYRVASNSHISEPRVRKLADEIIAAQRREISEMS